MNWPKWQDVPVNGKSAICIWKFGTWGTVFGGSQNCLQRESGDGRWKVRVEECEFICIISWLSRAKQQNNANAMMINVLGLSGIVLCGANNQNHISRLDGEPHGILLRLRGKKKKNAPLQMKQFNDDSMKNTALITLYFCSSWLDIRKLCSWFNQNTLISPKKEGNKIMLFSIMLPWDHSLLGFAVRWW